MAGLRAQALAVVANCGISAVLYLIGAQILALAAVITPNQDTAFMVSSECVPCLVAVGSSQGTCPARMLESFRKAVSHSPCQVSIAWTAVNLLMSKYAACLVCAACTACRTVYPLTNTLGLAIAIPASQLHGALRGHEADMAQPAQVSACHVKTYWADRRR